MSIKSPETATVANEAVGQGGLPHSLQTHIGPLDGLRGWAAIMVVLGHFSFYGPAPISSGQLGDYGVFLFFVLSGFLMSHLYLAKPMTTERLKTYCAARISRIVPLYYIVVVAGFLIGVFVDPGFKYAMSAATLVRHLLFVGNTSVFWSIGPEFQFYFVFPVLWWICSMPPARGWRWGSIFAALAVVVILFRSTWPGMLFLSKLHIFLMGCALAPIRRAAVGHLDQRTMTAMQMIAGLGLVVLLLPEAWVGTTIYPHLTGDSRHDGYYQDLGKLLWMGATVLSFTVETRFANAIFANPLARHLGRCSFSIYLLNIPVLYVLRETGVLGQMAVVPALALALVAVMLAASCSYFVIEDPSRVHVRALVERALSRIGGTRRSTGRPGETFVG